VGDLVRKPEGDQLGIETQPLSLGVCNAGKVLKADKSDSLAVDYQLARVRGADSYHKHYINVRIDIEQDPALLFRIPRERNDIDSLKHCSKIYAACKCGRANDFQKAEIGGDTVGTVVNCEKIRQ